MRDVQKTAFHGCTNTEVTAAACPSYAFLDVGDHVVVVNAEKILLTGRKPQQKTYYHHSGYPGGLREIPYEQLMSRHPERAVTYAVRGMLPKNRLGRKLLRKLRVYAGPDHPHKGQTPKP